MLQPQERYKSLYNDTHSQRVGPSCPVSFNSTTKRYCGWIIRDGRGVMAWERPSIHDRVVTFEAGQYGSGYAAVICG